MKIYNNMDEVTADVKDGILRINDDVTFNCDVAGMFDIKARNIFAQDIDAWEIDAHDIIARDIYVCDIDAHDISYYATCSVMKNIVCKTIKGRLPDAKHFSLEHGKIVIKNKE